MCTQKSVGKIPSSTNRLDLPKEAKPTTLKLPTFSTRELFGSAKEIGIEHENLLYRLRITKQGKLILNK